MSADGVGQWTPARTLGVVSVAAVLVAALVLVGSIGGGGGSKQAATDPSPSEVSTRQVMYTLTGTADGADLTWTDGRGQTTQATGKAVPLVQKDGDEGITFEAEPGVRLYFSAQNTGATGSLTCQILVNDQVVASNTSDGGYSIVTCEE